MSEILNKSEITKGQKQYHIALSPGEIGEYVLLPGDPARSDIVAIGVIIAAVAVDQWIRKVSS